MKKFYFVLLMISLTAMCGCFEQAQETTVTVPTKEPFSENGLRGKILWHGSRALPELALTFDDGPNSQSTAKVLDILKKYHVKATFFLIGKFIEKNKDLVSREAAEGHNIGNHTYSHVKGTIVDIKQIKRELSSTDALILKYSGKKAKYFRPPFGFENWRFLTEAELLDYSVVLWTMDVGDWNQGKKSKEISSKIISQAKNGAIILLHDGGLSREAVISALPVIITKLKKKGYRFVTIDEMIEHL